MPDCTGTGEDDITMKEKKLKKRAFILGFTVILMACFLMVSGCSEKKKEIIIQSGEEPFRIVTSFYPLYIMMINLTDGAPGVEIANMAEPQTGCLHDYQLRPKDLVCLEGADIFVANGGGMESFLGDVLETYPELTIVYALDAFGEEELLPGGEEDEGGNPHTWMSMELYKKELRYLEQILAELDNENAKLYETNRETYEEKVNALENEYEHLLEDQNLTGEEEFVEESMKENHKSECILLHESFAYLAEDCGFTVTDILDVEKDSGFSAKEIRELVDKVRKDWTGCILSDSQYSGRIAALLSEETGLPVYQLDSGVSGEYEKDAYLNSMRDNLEELKNAAN